MAINDFHERILAHPDDVFGPLALRVTARSLPLITAPTAAKQNRGDKRELFYLDLFRTLILCCAMQSKISPNVAISMAEKYDNLSNYYNYSMGVIAFRACLRSNLPIPRPEKIEELRRCTQSAYDLAANVAMRNGSGIQRDFWERFDTHLLALESGQPSTQRAINVDELTIIGYWNRLSSSLSARNETWKIWIEWFEFRFMGRAGESVPTFLWGEIENRFISNGILFQEQNVNLCNQHFAQCALDVVEEFADFQSNAAQISGGVQFQVGDDCQIMLSDFASSSNFPENSSSSTIVEEVINVIKKMKEECKLNSATYLTEAVDSYSEAFTGNYWNDPAKVVVRGDALRQLLSAQLSRNASSDLPELLDRTVLIFRNLVRSHNLLVNVYHELSEIDAGLASNTISRSQESVNGLKKIINYAEARISLDRRARASIEAIISLGDSPDEADRVKIGITISNFAQSTFSYIWRNKNSIFARAAAATGGAYALAQWALANEKWISSLFTVNSEVGALIMATLRFLHKLPLL